MIFSLKNCDLAIRFTKKSYFKIWRMEIAIENIIKKDDFKSFKRDWKKIHFKN